jgi:cystathionine beta-synthase
MFNDDWMRERGFLEEKVRSAADLTARREDNELITIKTEELVSHAIERMRTHDISQLPVMDAEGFVGSLDEGDLFRSYFEDKDIADRPIKEIMNKPFPIVQKNASLEDISKLIDKNNPAVLVQMGSDKFQIVTKHDIIRVIG